MTDADDAQLTEQLAEELTIAVKKHASDMSTEEKYQLITRNLQEV